MNVVLVTDIDFLTGRVGRREHFLYVYKKDSGLLRPKVVSRIRAFAEQESWDEQKLSLGSSLESQLQSPSLFGEIFFVGDGADFRLKDLKETLDGVAVGRFEHHLLLIVREGSAVLEQPEWFRAKAAVGLIEEPTISVKNYRSITRYLLKASDLVGVVEFGEDERFLARVKAFVQERGRSPFELSLELDRIILTEVREQALTEGRQATERRERRVLSEGLNRFLDDRSTATLHPLLRFLDEALMSGGGSNAVLGRLFRASESIVARRDQRYKRNREGSQVVDLYLVWGVLMLTNEVELRSGPFLVGFERLCQEFHSAARNPAQWWVGKMNWQSLAKCLTRPAENEPDSLDRSREALRSALGMRIGELFQASSLNWLVPALGPAQAGAGSAGV